MKLNEYVIVDGKKLRCGYTTGSCAQAATKASATMLLTGEKIDYVEITTPSTIVLRLPVEDIFMGDGFVSCAIRKDSGDDPDVTDGSLIYSKVYRNKTNENKVLGGKGVGRINRKGLFGEIGEPAINPVPKKLILQELARLGSGLSAEIFVPQGEILAKKTFNEGIGIVGGISIIGTKGIVYPMSEDALKQSIYMEIDMLLDNQNEDKIMFTPGNHGEKLADSLGIKTKRVKVSNYIGDSLSYAYEKGLRKFFVFGHIGKLSKLSVGVFNTHNRTADTRMEAFVYYMAKRGLNIDLINEVDGMLTAEMASLYLLDKGYKDVLLDMQRGAEKRIKNYLKDQTIEVETLMYTMERGLI